MKTKDEIEEKASEYVEDVKDRIDSYAYLDVQEAFAEGAKWMQEQVNGVEQSANTCNLQNVSNRAGLISDIVKALKSDDINYVFKDCPTCKGKGYAHGYGTHSVEPDWCDECGGLGEIVDEDATRLVKLQIVSKVLKEHGY